MKTRFSKTFENICNFIAVSKTGNPQETICGLIIICIIEFPNENFNQPKDISEAIYTLFGLELKVDQIKESLEILIEKSIIIEKDSGFVIDDKIKEETVTAIEEAKNLENSIKSTWYKKILEEFPSLDQEQSWIVLQTYLSRAFRRHGMQAASLLELIP